MAIAAANEPKDIERLIRQLGSDQFAEREAATQALDKVGAPALPALRSAIAGGDAEVRRRAERLMQNIEQRLETEELLQPTKIRLDYKDVPLSEVVADLSKRAGLPCELTTDGNRLGERRVTISTPELPLWEAFEQLCEKAQVTAQLPAPKKPAQSPNPNPAQPFGNLQPVVVVGENRIALVAGKPQSLPTFHAGALRLRAVPAPAADPKLPKGETEVMLEVSVEPKLQWQNLVQVRFEEIRDDKKRVVAVVPPEENTKPMTEEDLIRLQLGALQQRQVVRKVNLGPGVSTSSLTASFFHTPVRLKLPDDPGQLLPSMKGVLTAQVQTPVQTLAAFDEPAKAVGKTVKAKDGAELKLVGFQEIGGGVIRVQIDMTPSGKGLAGGINNMIMMNVQVVNVGNVRGPNNVMSYSGSPFVLRDKDDQPYNIIGMQSNTEGNNGSWTQKYILTMQPPNAKSAPKALVYSASRLATIEVPFELKNVQLP
jgi:hypothetical protein